MDTRYGKRGGKAEENNEANPELLQAVEEDLAQEFEEVPIQPKKRKQMPPKKTRALELAKLKEQTKMDRQKIEHLEERINYLEEANRDLKADKDFLLAQIKKAPSTPASSGKGLWALLWPASRWRGGSCGVVPAGIRGGLERLLRCRCPECVRRANRHGSITAARDPRLHTAMDGQEIFH
ncbi:unnamed protein product [Merluccius merluccius]